MPSRRRPAPVVRPPRGIQQILLRHGARATRENGHHVDGAEDVAREPDDVLDRHHRGRSRVLRRSRERLEGDEDRVQAT
jgi:hypothetical protein